MIDLHNTKMQYN